MKCFPHTILIFRMLRNNSDARRYSYFDLDSLELPAMEVPQFASTIYQSQEGISHSLLLKPTPDKIKFFKKTQEHNKTLKKQRTINSFIIFSVFSRKRPCSLGTRERSIFGTHTLAPTR